MAFAGHGAAHINRGNAFVPQLGGLGRPSRVHGLRQPGRLPSRASQQHRVARALGFGADFLVLAQLDLGTLGAQPSQGRVGEQGAHVAAWQQKIGTAGAAVQSVAQHPQKHGGAGLVHGGVQGRNTQRFDQMADHPWPQSSAQLANTHAGRAGKSSALPARRCPQQGEFVAPVQCVGSADAPQQVPRGGQVGQFQADALGVAQVQRHAPEQVLWVQAQLAHQSQSLGIGPDQQVRAVVQRQALVIDAPGPSAQDGRGFQQADLPTQLGGAHRSGQTRPATPNDGQAFQKRPRA